MAIQPKKYKTLGAGFEVKVVKITIKNLTDLVAYICRNGGAATGHIGRPEYNRPARIRIKQQTYGNGWSKKDWRVANLGDYIIRWENGDFERIKAADFDNHFVAI